MEFSSRAAELTTLLESRISNFYTNLKVDEIGRVVSVGDGIARVYGLKEIQAGEMSEFAPISIYLVISLLVSLILLGLSFQFASNSSTYPEKLSAYESGQLRLLEVDNRVVVPAKTHLRIIVTSADVLNSWAVPSLGLKCDAVPNQISILALFSCLIVSGERVSFCSGERSHSSGGGYLDDAVRQFLPAPDAGPSTASPALDQHTPGELLPSLASSDEELFSRLMMDEVTSQPTGVMDQAGPSHLYNKIEAVSGGVLQAMDTTIDLVYPEAEFNDPVYQAVDAINNACDQEQERIVAKTRALLAQKNLALFDPQDVNIAVDNAMTNERTVDIDSRLSRFRDLRRYLGTRNCTLWPEIVKELRELGNHHVHE
ncbi:uncharacterized protein LOC122037867 [Zingiber officinale]|nr:uncharacterized protein LOC122037867 [Zingiber officinale]KAG6467640.1 hypothetical protein ZIOFF_074509 [Zingiber officinale]